MKFVAQVSASSHALGALSQEDQQRRKTFSTGVTCVYFLVTALVIFGCFSLEDDVKRWLEDEDDEVRKLESESVDHLIVCSS